MALWNNLEELLPPSGSGKAGKDPVGLISLVDRAYSRAYKLHKAYSSAMRFHCAARWATATERALVQSTEGERWKKILISVAESEYGTYRLDGDKITLTSRSEERRIDTLDSPSRATQKGQSVTGVLFR